VAGGSDRLTDPVAGKVADEGAGEAGEAGGAGGITSTARPLTRLQKIDTSRLSGRVRPRLKPAGCRRRSRIT